MIVRGICGGLGMNRFLMIIGGLVSEVLEEIEVVGIGGGGGFEVRVEGFLLLLGVECG